MEHAPGVAESGWDVATTFWRPYDASMPWGSDSSEVQALRAKVESLGARATSVEAVLSLTLSATRVTLAIRVGMPQDCANLVRFLCSREGGWVNAQQLYSNGGLV